MVSLLGTRDELLKLVEQSFDVDILVRGNDITISGSEAEAQRAAHLFTELVKLLDHGFGLDEANVAATIAMVRDETHPSPSEVLSDEALTHRGKAVRPKTAGQKRYLDAMRDNTVVFGIGPAGTGKTYLAMAMAVLALKRKEVNRMILTRPAVEAGERLGYLPGTLFEKIDPYLRPLFDALYDMMDPEQIQLHMERGTIEVAPLAYMRGRAQPLFSTVATPTGFRPIGDLEPGDLVVGSDGRPTAVLGVYPQGAREVFRVSAQDGASTLCCGEHLWAVRTAADRRRGRPLRVLATRDMRDHLGAGHARRFELPLVSRPVEFPEREVPMDPYALGLLLGDGCLTRRTTPTLADRGRGGVIVADPVMKVLVPERYLHNAGAVRLAVLQGLLDTAGVPVTQSRTWGIQYPTTSPRLRDDVVFIVRSLGGVARWRARAAEDGRSGAFVLDIHLPEHLEPFRVSRKRATYRLHRGGDRPRRFIDSIEPAGVEETVCIQVAAADSLYVTDDFLVTHNTINDSFIVLDEAQNTTPEQMKMFLTRLGFGSKAVITGDVTQVDLPAGRPSGLRIVSQILQEIDGVAFCELTGRDVVRHRIVQEIVEAYGRYDVAQAED